MSDIAAAAQALHDRHAALLTGDDCGHVYAWQTMGVFCQRCGYHEGTCADTVCSGIDGDIGAWRDDSAARALDAARERLQGGKRPDAPQLTLDLGRER